MKHTIPASITGGVGNRTIDRNNAIASRDRFVSGCDSTGGNG